MLVELGLLSLFMAFSFAIMLAIVPLHGYRYSNDNSMMLAKPLSYIMTVFVVISFVILMIAFAQDDFSVRYIAENSNSTLPFRYKLSAVWGGHEGSLLLWIMLYAGYTASVANMSNKLPLCVSATTLGVLGGVAVGFLAFILFTSNPFERILPYPPIDGRDLNPLLQDFGLIIHPPMLYMGYVGCAVCFAFALSALIIGEVAADWTRWVRRYALVAWSFLTLGITLGSWWAYYELGWGGWWFWDPVENASLMPWLVLTALIHSLIVTEKRKRFLHWSLLLSIVSFCLSLLGTFLVRSGVLTSVHAFANDAERGLYILLFLVSVVATSLILYGYRGHLLKSDNELYGLSRETLLLVNNLILGIAAVSVILGTLYPLFVETIYHEKLSVGPPYYNTIAYPLTLLTLFFMLLAPISRWSAPLRGIGIVCCLSIPAIIFTLILATSIGISAFWFNIAMMMSFWLLLTTIWDFSRHCYHKINLQILAMQIGHFALALLVSAICLTTSLSIERDVKLSVGESIEIAGLNFQLDKLENKVGANYSGVMATVSVKHNGEKVTILQPEKRLYHVQNMALSETAIDIGIFRDVYVALGEPLSETTWAMRIYYKPMVRWLWFSGLLLLLAGIIAAYDNHCRWKSHAKTHNESGKVL